MCFNFYNKLNEVYPTIFAKFRSLNALLLPSSSLACPKSRTFIPQLCLLNVITENYMSEYI